MNVKYFKDTDTTLLEFNTSEVVETKEISENIYIDIDSEGNLVNMTIEHASKHSGMPHFSFTQFDTSGTLLT